jgi:hypothetical protein
MRKEGIIFLCITKKEVKLNEAYGFLTQVLSALSTNKIKLTELDKYVAYGLKSFEPQLETLFVKFNANSGLSIIINNLNDAKDIMMTNLCKVMEKDCHLNDMMEQADTMNKRVEDFGMNVYVEIGNQIKERKGL